MVVGDETDAEELFWFWLSIFPGWLGPPPGRVDGTEALLEGMEEPRW